MEIYRGVEFEWNKGENYKDSWEIVFLIEKMISLDVSGGVCRVRG